MAEKEIIIEIDAKIKKQLIIHRINQCSIFAIMRLH